jgi:hypothetical protein
MFNPDHYKELPEQDSQSLQNNPSSPSTLSSIEETQALEERPLFSQLLTSQTLAQHLDSLQKANDLGDDIPSPSHGTSETRGPLYSLLGDPQFEKLSLLSRIEEAQALEKPPLPSQLLTSQNLARHPDSLQKANDLGDDIPSLSHGTSETREPLSSLFDNPQFKKLSSLKDYSPMQRYLEEIHWFERILAFPSRVRVQHENLPFSARTGLTTTSSRGARHRGHPSYHVQRRRAAARIATARNTQINRDETPSAGTPPVQDEIEPRNESCNTALERHRQEPHNELHPSIPNNADDLNYANTFHDSASTPALPSQFPLFPNNTIPHVAGSTPPPHIFHDSILQGSETELSLHGQHPTYSPILHVAGTAPPLHIFHNSVLQEPEAGLSLHGQHPTHTDTPQPTTLHPSSEMLLGDYRDAFPAYPQPQSSPYVFPVFLAQRSPQAPNNEVRPAVQRHYLMPASNFSPSNTPDPETISAIAPPLERTRTRSRTLSGPYGLTPPDISETQIGAEASVTLVNGEVKPPVADSEGVAGDIFDIIAWPEEHLSF